MNIAEIGQMFATVNEERKSALSDAMKACLSVKMGHGSSVIYRAGWDDGVKACLDAISAIVPD